MAEPKRHFWGWDAPVLDKAVTFLIGHALPKDAVLDLSDTLLIVPTMEAGRRLKEALARARPHSGVLVPWVWTPEQALLPASKRPRAASAILMQMAWQRALQSASLTQLRALLPVLPEDRGWAWQADMARLLMELKAAVGAGGLSFDEVKELLPHDTERWRDLALLEAVYEKELRRVGVEDVQRLKRAGAEAPELPEGVQRVVVLAAPDLPPLFSRWVRACAMPVEVAVQAPPELADGFDEIGRPLEAVWGEKATQVIPLDRQLLHWKANVAAQAEAAIEELRALAPLGAVALGACDPETGAVLEEKLTLEKVQVFQAGGVPVSSVGLWHVLKQVNELLVRGAWKPFAALLRVPEARQALAGSSRLSILKAADELEASRMPVTLEHALELLSDEDEVDDGLRQALGEARQWIAEWKRRPLPEAARALLVKLYGERSFAPQEPRSALIRELADAWIGGCEEIQQAASDMGLTPRPEELFALSLQWLESTELSPPRGDVDLVLQGWLELLWESAPHLVVTGMNEEFVPGILMAHPFLPDGARRQLQLPCQGTRFARDAYILRVLAEQRQVGGALRLFCGRNNEQGDVLRPSRLLFLCEDEALPDRVAWLFPQQTEGEGNDIEPARTVAWKLRPHMRVPEVKRISPSRLRAYLECPFRYYLSHELRMESVQPGKRELAAPEFGNLVHAAFQQLAADTRAKESADAEKIADCLIDAALSQARQLYGSKPAPLIALQLESVKQRLRHAAEAEAAERAQGWRIYLAEWSPEEASSLEIAGARLNCKVDRVDRHESSGRIRVLDFKTSDSATSPRDAHVDSVTSRRVLADEDVWKTFHLSTGERWQWLDLQLPLYAAALQREGLRVDEVGYFALPKSVQETKVLMWEDFNEEWVEHALVCAGEVVERLRAGRFWPPAAKAHSRDYDELFLGDLEAAVEMPLPSA